MTLAATPFAHLDLPALKAERRLWSTWLSRILSGAFLIAIALQLGQVDAQQFHDALPQNFWFLPVLLALYFTLPVADWIIFRRLWALPATGFFILLAKRIGNEVLISYSGEVYFYLWARKRTDLSAAPFGAIKDVNILSALAANLVALLLLVVTYPFVSQLNLGAYADTSVICAAAILLLSFMILLFSRRVFTLERTLLWWIFGVHILRLSAGVLLCALLWFIILPGPHFGFWLVLSMVRLLVGRLPFLPNKEALFAVIAIFLVGQDSAVSTLITLTATAILALHVMVATLLGALTLLFPNRDIFPEMGKSA
ncbi:MAG: hypothetical protein RLZZ61_380 [Pseudomonadota bacterium]|jgi:hypothetical protein